MKRNALLRYSCGASVRTLLFGPSTCCDSPDDMFLLPLRFLLFLTLTWCTTSAGIFLPESTGSEPPDLSDPQRLPSLSTIVPGNDLAYNNLPWFEFASPSNPSTLPDITDRTSTTLLESDELSSSSIASVDLGKPDIQNWNSEIVQTPNSKGDEASPFTIGNPDSEEISSTDPLFINSIALTGGNASGRICHSRDHAASGKRADTKDTCKGINPRTLFQYKTNSNTPDAGDYTEEQVEQNDELSRRDDQWVERQKIEGFDFPWENEGSNCEHAPGGRLYSFCCMGPYQTVPNNPRLKPRQKSKRYAEHRLDAGNCIVYSLGRPRCYAFSTRFCCYSFGPMMRWGWLGVDCVLMDP